MTIDLKMPRANAQFLYTRISCKSNTYDPVLIRSLSDDAINRDFIVNLIAAISDAPVRTTEHTALETRGRLSVLLRPRPGPPNW